MLLGFRRTKRGANAGLDPVNVASICAANDGGYFWQALTEVTHITSGGVETMTNRKVLAPLHTCALPFAGGKRGGRGFDIRCVGLIEHATRALHLQQVRRSS